jgi:hypothetical protein
MRFYDIKITSAKTGALVTAKSLQNSGLSGSTFTSFANGRTIPGALNIEINIPAYNYANPLGGAALRVWGVSLDELSQANDLAGNDIVIRAGMQKGLPLANPKQIGVIMQARIFQAFGNWQGTSMALDMQFIPPTGEGITPPGNFSFNWKKGTMLADAIRATLQVAMPAFTIQMAISDRLVSTVAKPGVYGSLSAFSKMIEDVSKSKQYQGITTKSGAPYTGVKITISGKNVIVQDGTKDLSSGQFSQSNPKVIEFQDLIGQPTWYSPSQINFKVVMRGDLSVSQFVKLPDLSTPFVLTAPGAGIPGNASTNKSAFKGIFEITGLHHMGNFRQADANAWITSVNAVFNNSSNDLAKQLAQGVIPP